MDADPQAALEQRRADAWDYLLGGSDPAEIAAALNYADVDDLLADLDVILESLTALDRQGAALTMFTNLDDAIPDAHARYRVVAERLKMGKAAIARAAIALEAASQSYGVKNTATALMLVLEVFTRHLDELTEGYLDGLGEPVGNARRVPLATVIGDPAIPAQAAAKLKKVLDRMTGRGEIDPARRWQALERLADAYLADGAAEPKN